jgi:hypothetical protein
MIPDAVIWRAAIALVNLEGDDAIHEAAHHVNDLLDAGDLQGACTWHWDRALLSDMC